MKLKPFINLFFYSVLIVLSLFITSVNAENQHVTDLVSKVELGYEKLHTGLILAEKETGDQKLIAQLKLVSLLEDQKESMDLLLEIYRDDASVISASKVKLITAGISRFVLQEKDIYNVISIQIKEERRSMGAVSGEVLIQKEIEVANKQGTLDTLLAHMHSMTSTLGEFEHNAEEYDQQLMLTVKNSAIESSLLLDYVGKQKKKLQGKFLGGSTFEKDALAIEIRRLTIKEEVASKTLKLAIDILDLYKIDVDKYRAILIENVGVEGAKLFQGRVVSRILNNWLDLFLNWLGHNIVDYTINIFIFSLIILMFYVFSNFAKKVVVKATLHSKLNISKLLRKFIITTTSRIIMFIGLMVAFSYLGIELAPLLTGFGVAGIVIGFALQGTLSNFASGIMMLLYRPFDVGDMILAGGEKGTVEKLNLVNTTIHTIDNRRVVLPNNLIWEGTITNISAENLRRVDLVFGIGYSDDLLLAEKVMMDEVTKHTKVLGTPEPIVKVAELGDSSVNFWVRPWVENEDYWDVHWDLTKAIKLRLDKEGISIPFPQRDVHIYSTEKPLVISKGE